MFEPILRTERLTRRFGELTAVDNVSLELNMGEVHAVIGPKGAGKSTLVNLLTGDLPPTSGSIYLRGQDIAGLSAARISRMGIARSCRKSDIALSLTVFENCRRAARSHDRRGWRICSSASRSRDIDRAAEEAMEAAELAPLRDKAAGALAYGEQRRLEIAMCLATGPRVLLLDEPFAGLEPHESQRMVGLIKKLGMEHALMLIEHDMDAVSAVAHRLTMMVNGVVLESGTMEELAEKPDVMRRYPGA
jgi:branched-chain amino acid transport system ATP-binding protein